MTISGGVHLYKTTKQINSACVHVIYIVFWPFEEKAVGTITSESQPSNKEAQQTNLSLSCHSKQSLLASNNLHRSDSTKRLARLWKLNFPAFNSAQLSTMVVAPAIYGTTPAPGDRPIRGAPENETKAELIDQKGENAAQSIQNNSSYETLILISLTGLATVVTVRRALF